MLYRFDMSVTVEAGFSSKLRLSNYRFQIKCLGDPRVNQQPPLTVVHTIFLREHNLLCDQLFLMNHHWSDEKLFQEARRILIAQHQHIIYAHYLPLLLGKAIDY